MGIKIKKIVRAVAAPVVAPTKAVINVGRAVASGSTSQIGKSALGAGLSTTPIAQGEISFSKLSGSQVSPTGYGAYASGDYSKENFQKVLTTSATLGGIAAGGATGGLIGQKIISGDIKGAALDAAGASGFDPNAYLPGGLSDTKNLLDPLLKMPSIGSSYRTPANANLGMLPQNLIGESESRSISPVLIVGAVLGIAYFLLRKK